MDDTTLDQPAAKKVELVPRHWSGKHHAVVAAINLVALLWSEWGIPDSLRLARLGQTL